MDGNGAVSLEELMNGRRNVFNSPTHDRMARWIQESNTFHFLMRHAQATWEKSMQSGSRIRRRDRMQGRPDFWSSMTLLPCRLSKEEFPIQLGRIGCPNLSQRDGMITSRFWAAKVTKTDGGSRCPGDHTFLIEANTMFTGFTAEEHWRVYNSRSPISVPHHFPCISMGWRAISPFLNGLGCGQEMKLI